MVRYDTRCLSSLMSGLALVLSSSPVFGQEQSLTFEELVMLRPAADYYYGDEDGRLSVDECADWLTEKMLYAEKGTSTSTYSTARKREIMEREVFWVCRYLDRNSDGEIAESDDLSGNGVIDDLDWKISSTDTSTAS